MVGSPPLWLRWAVQPVAVVALCALLPAYSAILLPPAEEPPLDFFQEWSSARAWFDGQPVYGDIGDFLTRTKEYEPRPGEVLVLKYNAHPPGSVLLVLPLGALPYRTALVVWHVVSLLAFLGALLVLLTELRLVVPPWLWLPLVVVLLICNPLSQQFHQGQLNCVLLLPIMLAWSAARHERPVWAGVWVGVAAALKLFPAFLLWYFLWNRQWRAIGAALVTLAVALLLVVLILGVPACQDYVTRVVPSLTAFRCSWINASLWGFWFRLFGGSASEHVQPLFAFEPLAYTLVFMTALLILAVLATVTVRSHSRPRNDAAWGLHLTAMLLLAPLTWDHSLLLLTGPLVIAGRDLLASPRWRLAFFTVLCLFWVNFAGFWKVMKAAGSLPVEADPLLSLTLLALPNYALLAFFALQLAQWNEAA